MKRIRIGNDITLLWKVLLKGGEPYNLEGKNLFLCYTTLSGVTEVKDFSVNENTLTWTFLGKDQKVTGAYTLTLVENKGEKGMLTVDVCEPFRLVDRSCMADDGNTCGNVSVESVEVESSIDMTKIKPVIPEIGENGNWWIEGKDTGKPARGEKGEDFTFEDFTPEQIADLKKPAVDAAETANTAAKRAKDISDSVTSAEELRVEAENSRVEAENKRVTVELGRVDAEGKRTTAEEGRVIAEGNRETAETARVDAETERANAESLRSTSEQKRMKNENSRITAEEERVLAEQKRVEAENKRVTDSATAIGNANTATNNANNAAAEAQEQGNYAKNQGDYAKDFVNEVNVSFKYPTGGIGGTNKYTLETAIAKIPEELRHVGIKCSFLGEKGKIENYVFKDGNWSDITSWEAVGGGKEYTFSDDFNVNGESVALSEMAKKRLFIDLWNKACGTYGKYNDKTGFFELNGLNDISYQEALLIYQVNPLSKSIESMLNGSSVRTCIPPKTDIILLRDFALRNKTVEILNFNWKSAMSIQNAFYHCENIREINKLTLNVANESFSELFQRCFKLEYFDFRYFKEDLNLKDSPLLRLECLSNLIQYSRNTNSITITVHPDVYTKLTDVNNAEWNKVLTDAAAKNISFATV